MNETGREIMAAYEAGVNISILPTYIPAARRLWARFSHATIFADKVNIADKLPHYLIKSRGSLDKYFDEHLRRLQTDRIDYYPHAYAQ